MTKGADNTINTVIQVMAKQIPNAAQFAYHMLEDDGSPFGGTSCNRETLEEFLTEIDMPLSTDMDTVNDALRQCGILPIIY